MNNLISLMATIFVDAYKHSIFSQNFDEFTVVLDLISRSPVIVVITETWFCCDLVVRLQVIMAFIYSDIAKEVEVYPLLLRIT